MDVNGRKTLPHEIPSWLGEHSAEVFFVTVCAQDRKAAPLVQKDIPARLLDAVRFYHERAKWWVHLALVMPDHLHLLASFPGELSPVLKPWKQWTRRELNIIWQWDFFDHRLRNEEKLSETLDYVLQNPVRAGLATEWREWPHYWMPAAG